MYTNYIYARANGLFLLLGHYKFSLQTFSQLIAEGDILSEEILRCKLYG